MAIIIGKTKNLYGANESVILTPTPITVPNVPAFTAPTIGFGKGSLTAVAGKIGTADDKIYFGYTDDGEGIVVANGKLVSSRVLNVSYTAATVDTNEGTLVISYLDSANAVASVSIPVAGAEQVADALDAAKEYTDNSIAALGGSASGSDTDAKVTVSVTTAAGEVSTVTVETDDIASATQVAADIKDVDDKVNTLIGTTTGDDAMSVREIANDAIAKFAEADGDTIDKLNEVIDWFNGVSTTDQAAAALLADVAANKAAIGVLEVVENDVVTTPATGIYKLIADLVKRVNELETELKGYISAEETRATTAETELQDAIDALDTSIGTAISEEIARAETAEEEIRVSVAANTTAIETNAANIQTISDTLSLSEV